MDFDTCFFKAATKPDKSASFAFNNLILLSKDSVKDISPSIPKLVISIIS